MYKSLKKNHFVGNIEKKVENNWQQCFDFKQLLRDNNSVPNVDSLGSSKFDGEL